MKNSSIFFVLFLFSCVPYSVVSFVYMKLTQGDSEDFWTAFIALLLTRTFFSVIETLGSVLTWRAYGNKQAIFQFSTVFKDCKFPVDHFSPGDVQEFLSLISNDPEMSVSTRLAAREFEVTLKAAGISGFLAALRTQSAAQEAYDQFKRGSVANAA